MRWLTGLAVGTGLLAACTADRTATEPDGIERVSAGLLVGKACSDDEGRRGGKEQTFPGHDSLLVSGKAHRFVAESARAGRVETRYFHRSCARLRFRNAT